MCFQVLWQRQKRTCRFALSCPFHDGAILLEMFYPGEPNAFFRAVHTNHVGGAEPVISTSALVEPVCAS